MKERKIEGYEMELRKRIAFDKELGTDSSVKYYRELRELGINLMPYPFYKEDKKREEDKEFGVNYWERIVIDAIATKDEVLAREIYGDCCMSCHFFNSEMLQSYDYYSSKASRAVDS